MKDHAQLTRTCSACGIKKPLAAFLEISSTYGTRYGTICATCRGTGVKERNKNKEEDSSSAISTGNRIGLKERAFAETKQKEEFITSREEYKEELKKRDEIKTEKAEKIDTFLKTQKDHRRTFLDLQSQPGFLGIKLPAGSVVRTIDPKKEVAKPAASEKGSQDKQAIETKQQEMEAERQETSKRTFNFRDQYVDPQAGMAVSFAESTLLFEASLPAASAASKMAKEQKKSAVSSSFLKSEEKKQTKEILDFMEKHWSVTPSRRR